MAADSGQGERAVASIFKRGGQKGEYGGEEEPPEDGARKLDTHLQTLAAAWGAPKTRRGMAAAVWRPALGAFEVVNRGRQTFAGQGFMHNKKLHFNVEEAVYLLDRAVTLLAIEDAHQQQHQQAPLPVQQRLLSMQEALHMMAVLQVPADRMVVLGHLSRLGFTVKRHPACWAVPAELPANHSWQITPAWAASDGLLPLSAEQAAAAAATLRAAAAAGSCGGGGGAPHNQRQHQHQQQQEDKVPLDSQQQQQQQGQGQLLESGGGKASPEQKQRKLEAQQETGKGQSADQDADQQQQDGAGDMPSNVRSWYQALPPWLQQHPPPLPQSAAANDVTAELPGVLLQRQFPLLQPLRRYRDVAPPPPAPGSSSSTLAAQQPGHAVTADLVFDVLLNQPHFSYRAPPRPHFSVAMVRQGCSSLPPLDELLDLSAAAAGGSSSSTDADSAAAPSGGAGQSAPEAAAAAAGSGPGAQQQQQQQQVSYQTVKFALPEEGDVSFCELRPVRLMNLLTNQH